ncbi:hypothetical protein G4X40_04080 [Rhodococcus sp. D2-41]|nr:hypothetical protein [Rhodococcus sp. D2-41]
MSRRTALAGLGTAAAALILAPAAVAAPAAVTDTAVTDTAATDVDRYLNLPLVNRDMGQGPGGVNPALPTDLPTLTRLLDQARRDGYAPTSYAALLFQYWLADTTQAAGIDLARWDPRAGVAANRENLVKSYTFYEQLQLHHRELQWAGMGGLVGADFGGGLLDFDLATGIYSLPGIANLANQIVTRVDGALGPDGIALLPEGLRALARAGQTITPEDLRYIQGQILVMQKNIFGDLMTMHRAYVSKGLPALEEMQRAGLFGDNIMSAWRDIASGNADRIANGNAVLLQREQGVAIKAQWDQTRAYKGDVGEAITYLSTVAGSPSVAGVLPPRQFHSVQISRVLPDGRTATLHTPLPDWNWSVYDQRWEYITSQLLPKYKVMVNDHWPQLAAELQVPYEQQLEGHRPINNIPEILQSALAATSVTYS